MGMEPEQICKKVWQSVVPAVDATSEPVPGFTNKCVETVLNPDTSVPSKQCAWENFQDKFVLNKKKKKIEMPEDKVISCLARQANDEKWPVKKPADAPKAVRLSADATPTADVKPADAPKVVGLPADATPVDMKPAEAPKVVGLSVDATSTSEVPNTGSADDNPPLLGWLGVVSGFAGFSSTGVGISANGQEPLHLYNAIVFAAAIGVLTPEIALWGALRGRIQLDAVFDSTWFKPKQDQDYGRSVHVWDLGPKMSLHGVYPLSKDGRIFFGPHVGYLMGGLSTDGAVEVAKGKGYDTDGKSSFITSLLYGFTVGVEEVPTDSQRAKGFCQFDMGMRQFYWGAKPESSNFPATMQINDAIFYMTMSLGVKFK